MNIFKIVTIISLFFVSSLVLSQEIRTDSIATYKKRILETTEVDFLKVNYTKAKKLLKWFPRYEVEDLVKDMIVDELSRYN